MLPEAGTRVVEGVNKVLVVADVCIERAGVLSVPLAGAERIGEVFRVTSGNAARGVVGDVGMELASEAFLGEILLGSSGILNTNSLLEVTIG